jgi:hypothetical protein
VCVTLFIALSRHCPAPAAFLPHCLSFLNSHPFPSCNVGLGLRRAPQLTQLIDCALQGILQTQFSRFAFHESSACGPAISECIRASINLINDRRTKPTAGVQLNLIRTPGFIIKRP